MRRVICSLLLIFALLAPLGAAWAGVNVNTATQAELETLPGIGPSKAVAIIQHREQFGPFASLNDLDAVPGIGPATLTNIQAMVEFGDGAAGAPKTTATSPAATATNPTATPATTAAPPPPSGRVNINTATAAQLEGLPGIGPAKAAAILQSREELGPFASCQDLGRVNGIGPATISLLLESCVTQ